MPTKVFQKFFNSYLAEQSDGDVLKGVVICQEGEAKGHGFYLGQRFLEQVVLIGNRKNIKVRVDHPEDGQPGKVLSIIGEALNFRLDGDKVRADIKLFDLPAKNVILQLAKQASKLFGMSMDFVGKTGKKLANGLEEVFCKDMDAVDFVESPAATTSLFSKKVDSKNNDVTKKLSKDNSMNLTLDAEMLKSLGLGDNADEKSVKAAIMNAIVKAGKHDEMVAKDEGEGDENEEMAEDDKGEGEKNEKMDDEGDKKKDKDESMEYSKKNSSTRLSIQKIVQEEVRRLAAKEVTKILAKTGAPAKKASDSQESQEQLSKKNTDENFGFNEEQIQFAKKNGIELKAWREALNKAGASVRL